MFFSYEQHKTGLLSTMMRKNKNYKQSAQISTKYIFNCIIYLFRESIYTAFSVSGSSSAVVANEWMRVSIDPSTASYSYHQPSPTGQQTVLAAPTYAKKAIILCGLFIYLFIYLITPTIWCGTQIRAGLQF